MNAIRTDAYHNFFSAVSSVAEQRIMAKKAALEAKKQAALSIIGKAIFKATGATLFGVEDRRGKEPAIMHLTLIAGKVRSCINAATGEECSGRRWSGHCCHEDRVMAYEAARDAELPPANEMYRDYERSLDEQTWDDRRRAFESLKQEVRHIEQRHEMGIVAELLPEMAAHDDVQAHVKDSIESGEGDWIDEQRAAWAKMTPDERRNAYCDDFGIYDYASYGAA